MTADCFFCRVARGEQEPEHVIYQDPHIVVFPSLHQRPQNQGHIEVATREHLPTLDDLPAEVAARVMFMSQRVAVAVKKAFGAEGTTIHQHNYDAGGQHLDHYHMHVVPRWAGDLYWASVGIREHEFLVVPGELLLDQTLRMREHLDSSPLSLDGLSGGLAWQRS